MRLIDADALCEVLQKMSNEPNYQHPDEDWCCGVYMALGAVEEAPTIEATPVVHGRWIPCENGGYYCSNCDIRVAFLVHNKHCPNCGAKMDGGVSDG